MMKALIITLLIVLTSGCASTKMFAEYRGYDVGRDVDLAYVPDPMKVTSHDDKFDKYYYTWNNSKCEFYYLVNKETNIVESWNYISDEKHCKLGYDWFGPW